ncbi:hypothetical protein BDV09DRAFT_179435 [Aspergillus tetrazonus]
MMYRVIHLARVDYNARDRQGITSGSARYKTAHNSPKWYRMRDRGKRLLGTKFPTSSCRKSEAINLSYHVEPKINWRYPNNQRQSEVYTPPITFPELKSVRRPSGCLTTSFNQLACPSTHQKSHLHAARPVVYIYQSRYGFLLSRSIPVNCAAYTGTCEKLPLQTVGS